MNRQDFLDELKSKISHLPQKDIDEHISFYSEMLDDRIEDGMSIEEAIAQIGSPSQIAKRILDENRGRDGQDKSKKRNLTWWQITLLSVGSPIWIALLASVFAVVISLFASLWSVAASFWAAFVSICASSIGGVACGFIYLFSDASLGFILIGAGVLLVGLSIFAFYGCKKFTMLSVWLTVKLAKIIKNGIVRKEKI